MNYGKYLFGSMERELAEAEEYREAVRAERESLRKLVDARFVGKVELAGGLAERTADVTIEQTFDGAWFTFKCGAASILLHTHAQSIRELADMLSAAATAMEAK